MGYGIHCTLTEFSSSLGGVFNGYAMLAVARPLDMPWLRTRDVA